MVEIQKCMNPHDKKLFLTSKMPSDVKPSTILTTLSGMTPDKAFAVRSMYDKEVPNLRACEFERAVRG